MRKGICSLLLLGLATALPAQAVYVNPRGTGQVLLFPYYTANAGQSTLIRVANTTDRAKLLVVRFMEGYNSRSVLEFTVILGPHDAWSADVRSLGGKTPANLHTSDPSCTLPDKPHWNAAPGGGWDIDMLRYAYTGANVDGGPTTAARTREGHIEIIEAAQLQGALAAAATSGPTRDCQRLRTINPADPDVVPPGGGLSGQFAIVDAAQGTYMGGRATALADFSRFALLNDSGVWISLQRANSTPGEAYADFLQNGAPARLRYSTSAPNNAIDAVSAVLAADTLSGDIGADASAGSLTEWVVTLPTRSFYTDNQILAVDLGDPGALAPFEQTFSQVHNGASCSRYEAVGYTDEGTVVSFNPAPTALPAKSLCRAVNVLSFGPLAPNANTPLLRSHLGQSLWNPQPAFSNGRVQLDFSRNNGGAARLLRPGLDGNVALRGLPLIGFAAYKFTRANALPGQLYETALHELGDSSFACVDLQGSVVTCP